MLIVSSVAITMKAFLAPFPEHERLYAEVLRPAGAALGGLTA